MERDGKISLANILFLWSFPIPSCSTPQTRGFGLILKVSINPHIYIDIIYIIYIVYLLYILYIYYISIIYLLYIYYIYIIYASLYIYIISILYMHLYIYIYVYIVCIYIYIYLGGFWHFPPPWQGRHYPSLGGGVSIGTSRHGIPYLYPQDDIFVSASEHQKLTILNRPAGFVSTASGWSTSHEVSKLGRPAAVALSAILTGRRPWDEIVPTFQFVHHSNKWYYFNFSFTIVKDIFSNITPITMVKYIEISPLTTGTAPKSGFSPHNRKAGIVASCPELFILVTPVFAVCAKRKQGLWQPVLNIFAIINYYTIDFRHKS